MENLSNKNNVTAVVLAGGFSTRLGQSKPLLKIGGKLLLARVADTLRPVVDELILVVRPDQDDAVPDIGMALRMHVVSDSQPYHGPLAAIHAGLEASMTKFAFLVGADHPFISRKLIRMLIKTANNKAEKTRSVFIKTVESIQPLHSVLEVKKWSQITLSALESGEHSFKSLLKSAIKDNYPPIEFLSEKDIEPFDEKHLSLLDIDTISDLGIVRKILSGQNITSRPDIRAGGV